MARTPATFSTGSSLCEHLSMGLLAQRYPATLVEEVLAQTNSREQRVRHLPSCVVVYYVIAAALFMNVSMREVLRVLLDGLNWLCVLARGRSLAVASKAALSKARARIGAAPLKALWEKTAAPLAAAETPGSFFRGLRLVSLDSSTLDLPDTAENAAVFGRPSNSLGGGAFPQLRFSALVECGTHLILAASQGPFTHSEHALAQPLLEALAPGMLCLADRYYSTYSLWKKAAQSGAHLLWRASDRRVLEPETVLADGTFLTTLYDGREGGNDRRLRRNGLPVRVVEYTLAEQPEGQPPCRLITTLLDPEAAPAVELARLYLQRWEIEGVFDEIKTHVRGGRVVLRSKRPELVEQEFWGLLLAHALVRELMFKAAGAARSDPDTLSFTHTIRLIRRKLASMPGFFPSAPGAHRELGGSGDT